jgi:4-amino-4-deoxy-L-arabinose transferase-like glycosyltransferase
MTLHHFNNHQVLPLYISVIILLASILFFSFQSIRASLVLLFIGALGIGFFTANLDPFLITWDEQFHALVAKNILLNPLKPTLYPFPLLGYDVQNWAGNHVWLHKQPLFLWQIAISLKLFGFNTLAVRLPSIVLHAIAALMIFRIGKITSNERVGYYAALFFTMAYYILELVAGKFSTDHNDISFLFYVIASFWAWFEYQHSKQKRFIIMIGLFAGFAVLVKWLVGLLIYAIWFFTLGSDDTSNWKKIKSYKPLFQSIIISFLVFVPWQIYTHLKFPNEAAFEYSYNTRHFFEALEGHTGDGWFHFNAFREIYGAGVAIPFLYLVGLLIFLYKIKISAYRYAILFSTIIIYTFYTLAATKMTSFTIIVSPFLFLGLASLIDAAIVQLKDKIRIKHFVPVFTPILLVVIGFFLLNPKKIQVNHTYWKPLLNYYREADFNEMNFIKCTVDQLGNNNYVVFNTTVRTKGNIAMMFFTNYIAYEIIPSPEQINQIALKKYKIAIWDNGILPSYIMENKDIIKIQFKFENYSM